MASRSRLPRPPIKTMTDFVVFAFVTIVVVVLLVAAVASTAIAVLDSERDLSALATTIGDILTTIIGALVGFLAGKGQGRSEVHDELAELDAAKRDARP